MIQTFLLAPANYFCWLSFFKASLWPTSAQQQSWRLLGTRGQAWKPTVFWRHPSVALAIPVSVPLWGYLRAPLFHSHCSIRPSRCLPPQIECVLPFLTAYSVSPHSSKTSLSSAPDCQTSTFYPILTVHTLQQRASPSHTHTPPLSFSQRGEWDWVQTDTGIKLVRCHIF